MKVNILDLIDFKKVDTLLEGFNKSTGFVTAILDLRGNVLSKSGWRRLCTEFHRINPETSKKCTISDTVLAGKMAEGEKYHFYRCLNGLVDVAVPIVIDGEHIANLFSGQFFFEEPDRFFFQKQAKEHGFDEVEYLNALAEVPVVSKEKVRVMMDFLLNMTQLISETTFQKLEQMELTDAVLKSEERFKTFMEKTPVYAYIKDNSLRHVFQNRKMLELGRASAGEREDDSVQTAFDTEIVEYLKAADQKIVSGNANRIELEYKVSIDGQEKWLNDIKFALNLADGKSGVGGLAFDITERKQAEEDLRQSRSAALKIMHEALEARQRLEQASKALRASEESYGRLFREMQNGFAHGEIICDDEGHPVNSLYLAVNPAFERLTGRKAEDVVGKTLLDVFPALDSQWLQTFGRVALTGEPAHFEGKIADLGLAFDVSVFCPAPNQYACTFSDITARKKAEEERQNIEQILQQAQKMEAIGTLAGGIAHDFNNILGAILGYAEMAHEDSLRGEVKPSDLDQVLQGCHRAKELVKQILAFSRQTEVQKIALHPAELVKESIKMLRSLIPTTITISQDLDPEVDRILADPTQIHQLIMNLCTNAYQAMEETGGTLSISLKNKYLPQSEKLDDPGLKPGHYVQLSIGDTGFGITPEIKERIFDPYFTTKTTGKGTGMGLAIVHGIVKSCGGSIVCRSTVNTGTVFDVFIPAIVEHAKPVSPEVEMIPTGTERILFVDDEEMLVRMIRIMLERLGYHVTVQRNSIDALAAFQTQPDAFDLVITDQTMPGMTGIDLAKNIMKIRPDMPVILCTGYSSQVSKEKALSLGVKGFAMKPLTRKDLAVLIREVLD